MANDVNDDAELIPNHAEAWNLAHYRRGCSNLARAYIELRELAATVMEDAHTLPDNDRMRAILHANDI